MLFSLPDALQRGGNQSARSVLIFSDLIIFICVTSLSGHVLSHIRPIENTVKPPFDLFDPVSL